MTLGPWLRACAARHGDREAVEVMGAAKSYAALDTDADRLAAGLTSAMSLRTGDRAAVIMRNSLACVDTWFAMARDALGIFTESEIKRTLLDVVDFCVDRAH